MEAAMYTNRTRMIVLLLQHPNREGAEEMKEAERQMTRRRRSQWEWWRNKEEAMRDHAKCLYNPYHRDLMDMYEFDVVILEDETGGYVALVPALPGCHTQGETLEELMKNVREAIELYLETLTDEEREEVLRQRMVGIQKVKAVV
jgi:predicted RNase H-like HicB family nuclease